MGTLYAGLAGNVTAPSVVNIASSTNVNPTAIATSAPHGLLTGDTVDIQGHQVNTNANGIWPVTVTSSTAFTIPRAANGVGAATGTVQLVSRAQATTIYSDGDPFTASNSNLGTIPPLDRTAFLFQHLGFEKRVGRTMLYFSNTGGTAWAVYNATIPATTWVAIPSTANNLSVLGTEQGVTTALSISAPFGFGGISALDNVRVSLRCNLVEGSAVGLRMGLFSSLVLPGASPAAFPTGYTLIPGCSAALHAIATEFSVFMEGYVTHPGSGGLYIQPALFSATNQAIVVTVQNDAQLVCEPWRITGWPQ